MNDRETRLPSWAQREMARLRADLADAKQQIATLTGSSEDESRPVVGWLDPHAGMRGEGARPALRAGETVRFGSLDGVYLDVTWTDRIGREPGHLTIRSGDGSLLARPDSGNMFRVFAADWYGKIVEPTR